MVSALASRLELQVVPLSRTFLQNTPKRDSHRSVPRPRAQTTLPPGGHRPPCHLDQRGRRKLPRISVVSEGPWRRDPQDPALSPHKVFSPLELSAGDPSSCPHPKHPEAALRTGAPSGRGEFWEHRSRVPSQFLFFFVVIVYGVFVCMMCVGLTHFVELVLSLRLQVGSQDLAWTASSSSAIPPA